MGWLITGLLLALLGGLAVFTRWARHRPVADDTLVADLLGPPVGQAPPAPLEQEDVEPPPAPAALPAGEGNWLETQLALIAAWSQRMQEQITSAAAGPDRPQVKPEPAAAAPPADGSRPAGYEPSAPPLFERTPGRCMATTAKGSQCKLAARPGETTCAIHAQRAHP